MRVVLSTQGSDECRAATEWCAEHLDATSTVVAVVDINALGEFVMGLPMFDLLETTDEVVAQVDRDLRGPLGARGIAYRTRVASTGHLHALVEAAADEGADLIVLGKVPHGALADALRGQTASHLVHRPPCPVLIVPTHPGMEVADGKDAARGRAIS